ncbi:hypothetical protein ASD79_20615 [Caulobacter sp. Root655]|uniref:hypothetical protein n=1 Tax=Caulobacter sp. Root655 TaxID=1736578 RepID=UPI0006F5D91E|nr:hypothetical protein [Caulobacter sp. Root655]KRA64277.1 hypothetical protein ASD79_20615 [Caulobacter sp. Root655]
MNTDFSWSQATFAGFGVLRREPRAWLLWGAVGLVFGLTDQLIAVNTEIIRGASRAPGWIVPILGMARGVVAVGVMAIFSAAVYRVVLQPESEARGRMRLGSDEIRLALVWLVLGLLVIIPFMISALPVAVASMGLAKQNDFATGLVAVVAFAAALISCFVLIARLSVAAPMALAEGRWSIAATWRLTRGRAWKIVGVYLPVLAAVLAIYMVWQTLYAALAHVMGGDFSVRLLTDGTSVSALFQPWQLAFTAGSAWLGAATAAVFHAPAAVIYRALWGDAPDDQAAVFD